MSLFTSFFSTLPAMGAAMPVLWARLRALCGSSVWRNRALRSKKAYSLSLVIRSIKSLNRTERVL